MESASSAAARLTTDSRASDSSPTEPVSHQANALRVIVANAAAIESRAYRASWIGSISLHQPSWLRRRQIPGRLRQLDERNMARLAGQGDKTPRLQRARQRELPHRAVSRNQQQRLRQRMRIRRSWLELLAGPAFEHYGLRQAASRPGPLVVEPRDIFRRLEHRRRIELVTGDLFPPTAL